MHTVDHRVRPGVGAEADQDLVQARLIDDPDEVARRHNLWVRGWGTAHTDRWMAIAMEIVTGRRIRRDIAAEENGN